MSLIRIQAVLCFGLLVGAHCAQVHAHQSEVPRLASDAAIGSAKFTFIPAPVSSHFGIVQPMMEELLKRGHLIQA